ncbi:MAG: hypothetical protein GFH27_549303n216 [Chloroflexi bacterium AL-W]|nr:hypothetical protein [Chloroflexi bacterium AL-N1]NOK68101.1 hypothetical protein [Chloroflexi bacterium AL-N10]NOK73441.1 hypothetical protein [Chloroflexi bacterium AL-N5]NOK83355.1 hypothetical protein [Chloroflexi bacterium AL-W]NOK87772.1 hypothetical protein [Chloroflexi bacterium AL-N15]
MTAESATVSVMLDDNQGLGRTLLVGLAFLVAADTIKTVAVTPCISKYRHTGAHCAYTYIFELVA